MAMHLTVVKELPAWQALPASVVTNVAAVYRAACRPAIMELVSDVVVKKPRPHAILPRTCALPCCTACETWRCAAAHVCVCSCLSLGPSTRQVMPAAWYRVTSSWLWPAAIGCSCSKPVPCAPLTRRPGRGISCAPLATPLNISRSTKWLRWTWMPPGAVQVAWGVCRTTCRPDALCVLVAATSSCSAVDFLAPSVAIKYVAWLGALLWVLLLARLCCSQACLCRVSNTVVCTGYRVHAVVHGEPTGRGDGRSRLPHDDRDWRCRRRPAFRVCGWPC